MQEEEGRSPVIKTEVNVVRTLDIYKRRVNAKDDRTTRLQVRLVGPDGGHAHSWSKGISGSAPSAYLNRLPWRVEMLSNLVT